MVKGVRRTFQLLLCFLSIQLLGQEIVWKQRLGMLKESDDFNPWVALSIPNDALNQLEIYFLNGKKGKRVVLSEDYQQLESSMDSFLVSYRYDEFLGYVANESESVLFFHDKKARAIHYLQFLNDDQQVSSGTVNDIELTEEVLLGAFESMGKFYLLTVPKRTSVIKSYAFLNKNLLRATEYDFSGIKLGDRFPDLQAAFQFDQIGVIGSDEMSLGVIKTNKGAYLKDCFEPFKIYPRDEEVLITLDHDFGNTVLLRIFLNSRFSEVEYYSHEMNPDFGLGFNSYITDDHIFQVMASGRELNLTVKNLKTKEKLVHLTAYKNEDWWIGNSPYYQSRYDDLFDVDRSEIHKSKDILKELARYELGLKVEKGENYSITIGGYDTVKKVTPLSAMDIGNMYLTKTVNNLIGKAGYFKTILSNSFEHTGDKVSEQVEFERLDTALKPESRIEFTQNWKGKFLYGFFDSSSEDYQLLKFN